MRKERFKEKNSFFCIFLLSYLRGILSSRAVLQGVGVGKVEATATSAILHYGKRFDKKNLFKIVLVK